MQGDRSRSSPIAGLESSASRGPTRLPRRAPGYANTWRTRRRGGRPARRSRGACPGTRRSRACSREGRLLLTAPSGTVRNRGLLGAALACTRPVAADVALFHVGNDPEAHGWIIDALRRRPGVVVLHDFVLHHLVAGLTIGRKDGPGYLAAMERDAGVPGRLIGHGVLDGRVPPPWETRPDEFPLASEVLGSATGLIVHSHYVDEQAREAGYRGPSWRIPHPAWPTSSVAPADVDGRPLFGCFGHINPSKRIPQLLEGFAAVRRRHPNAKLLLVGPASPRFDAKRLTGDGVERIDYVPEERLWSLMAACDACISLRSPTMGETSGSVIRALSLGRPLVVSDLGWFAELPDSLALKVPVGDDEVPALAASLELLASSEATQLAMSEAALAYVRREHDLGRVAEQYVAALEEAA